MLIRDAIVGRKNPWSGLFDACRVQVQGGIWNYLTENIDYPYYLVKDRLKASEGHDLQSLKPCQGKILKLDGQRVAAYRNAEGQAIKLSAVCPHLGCIVQWNQAANSWDCPCHGSRFNATGEVIAGPAESPLKPIE